MISTSTPKSSGGQDLDDAADGGLAALGKFQQLHVDDHALQLGDVRDGDRLDSDASWLGGGGGISMPSGISIQS